MISRAAANTLPGWCASMISLGGGNAAVCCLGQSNHPATPIAIGQIKRVIKLLLAQFQSHAQILPRIHDRSLVGFHWCGGDQMVDGGAAGEDAFGALADDDLDFGVGILTAGSDEGGSED
jgi:hypothetical protein